MPDSTNGSRIRSRLVLLAQFSLTFACLFFAVRELDWSQLATSIGTVDFNLLALGVLALCAQPIIGTVRWRLIVNKLGGRIGVLEAATFTYLGVFFNQALPASVGGDAIKVWLLHRRNHPLRMALNSIVLDRVFMLSGLLLIAAAGMWVAELDFSGMKALVLGAILCGLAGFVLICFADRIPGPLQQSRFFRIVSAVSSDTRSVALHPTTTLKLGALILLSYASMTVSLYLLVLAFGETLDFATAMVYLPAVLLASVLPVSVGGWGVREVAMVKILGLVGVSAVGALGASILFGIISLFVTLPGLFLYLTHQREMKEALHSGAPSIVPDPGSP